MFSKFIIFCLVTFCDTVIENYAFRVVNVQGVDTVLAVENENVTIECKKDIPMLYCGFLHPNGTRFSFSGMELNDGHCSITQTIMKRDSGEWRCHIGKKVVGAEIVIKINVRVADRLAAVEPVSKAIHNNEFTLLCTTTKSMVPLSYCRFEPPSDRAFSINADITPQNPILGRYFFPKNKSLDRGDCAVTIKKVKTEDLGNWTCGAGLEDDGKEYTDVIQLEIDGLYQMSAISVIGITFGACTIILMLGAIGYVLWKERTPSCQSSPSEEVEMRQIPPSSEPQKDIPKVVVQSPSEPSTPSFSS